MDKSEEEFNAPIQTYQSESKEIISQEFKIEGNLIVEKEMIGEMEVVEEKEEIHKKEKIKTQEANQMPIPVKEEPKQIFGQHEKANQPKSRKQKKESEGIKLTPEMEAKVNEKVEEMLHSEKESKEENKES